MIRQKLTVHFPDQINKVIKFITLYVVFSCKGNDRHPRDAARAESRRPVATEFEKGTEDKFKAREELRGFCDPLWYGGLCPVVVPDD